MVAEATAASIAGATWLSKDVSAWDNPEVRAFVDSVLPGHPCASTFRHTSGRVLGTFSKDDLRKQVKDEEAANVIWAELSLHREHRDERDTIRQKGGDIPFTLFVRTPADVSVELEVRATDTIAQLKERIAATEGTEVERQRLTRNGQVLLDTRMLASYNMCQGTMLLLVPRLSIGGQRYAAQPQARQAGAGALPGPPKASGIPRPRVPVACTDFARPFPMHLEFTNIPEYQGFMLALQKEAGRRNSSEATETREDAPFLEVLAADNMRDAVQTRISFDTEAEVLLIDTVGDMLMERTRYPVLLHLRAEQKRSVLVTGVRAER